MREFREERREDVVVDRQWDVVGAFGMQSEDGYTGGWRGRAVWRVVLDGWRGGDGRGLAGQPPVVRAPPLECQGALLLRVLSAEALLDVVFELVERAGVRVRKGGVAIDRAGG